MSGNKYGNGRRIPDNCMNKSDEFFACFCNKYANVLIRNQPQIVISFANRTAWLLEYAREIVAMPGIYFIK